MKGATQFWIGLFPIRVTSLVDFVVDKTIIDVDLQIFKPLCFHLAFLNITRINESQFVKVTNFLHGVIL